MEIWIKTLGLNTLGNSNENDALKFTWYFKVNLEQISCQDSTTQRVIYLTLDNLKYDHQMWIAIIFRK